MKTVHDESTEVRIQTLGSEILALMERAPKQSLFDKSWWYGSVMDLTMKDASFKTNMFRFVDVLPALRTPQEIVEHFEDYFKDGKSVFSWGAGLTKLIPSIFAGTVKSHISQLAKLFIAADSPTGLGPVLLDRRKKGISFTIDILGEATLSEKEGQKCINEYLNLMDHLAKEANKWSAIPQIDSSASGNIPKVNLSVKLTALTSLINEKSWDQTIQLVIERLRPIFIRAKELGLFINLDMEDFAVKNLTIEVFCRLLLDPELRSYPHFGCVIQAYLREASNDILHLVKVGKKRETPFTVRLVKGAYWDHEVILSRSNNWPIPVFTEKKDSDANYELCASLLMESYPTLRGAFGSHNARSIAACLALAEKHKVPITDLEFQMLFGMAENLKIALIQKGLRVREYTPVGEMIPGMAYLVRRLLENSSNQSWLGNKDAGKKTVSDLLASPFIESPQPPLQSKGNCFSNAAVLDWSVELNRKKLHQALEQLKLPILVGPRVNGVAPESTNDNGNYIYTRSPNGALPSNPPVTASQYATAEDAELAIRSATSGFATWSSAPVAKRAELLRKLGGAILDRRFELMAMQIAEVGKPWADADGDVCEAVDFCMYYAQEIERLSEGFNCGSAPGEQSQLVYRPRGPFAIIAPWNFPLAILTGMSVAALAAGNTVILKPAEQSGGLGQALYDMMMKVGFPSDAVQFLPGKGEEIGPVLVGHPQIAGVVFTGSRRVGLEILRHTGQLHPDSCQFKKVILELGGKNAILIDADADFDEAIVGVLSSAFGFAGQKCSAASRLIIVDSVYDQFVHRLVEAAKDLKVGGAADPSNDLGPVIDEESFIRIGNLVNKYKTQYKLLHQGRSEGTGYFIGPTIFGDVDPESELAQEEIFGPVLAIIRARDFEHGIAILNSTKYALTGGVYTRMPAHLALAKSQINVGNLYINRGITGALVERHPFGGHKLSGLGTKAGGRDYLKNFMDAQVVTENTVRRGFSPDVSG